MTKLTKKYGEFYIYNYDKDCDIETREERMMATHCAIVNKLGQLEDWEDLYGIDLLTLLKTEEVYWRIKFVDGSETDIEKSYKCYIDLHNHQLIVYSNEYDEFGCPLPFEDYGKTWALTMEELE